MGKRHGAPGTVALPAIGLLAIGLLAVGMSTPAHAFIVAIAPGTRALYLRVGDGAFTGNYNAGGTPGTLATINTVSVTVPAAVVGNGTSQAMTSNMAQLTSNYDGFVFCNAGQVYVGGFYRLPGMTGTATLSAVAPTSLTNATGDTIAFSQISWTSSGNQDGTNPQPVPAGAFTGGSQTLTTFPVNSWRESCHSFSYANNAVAAAGTYSGRVVYTLSAP